MTNLPIAAIMIVFAGGPHTPERTALACEWLTSHPPPAVIYLTGTEYRGTYSNLTAQVRSIAATLPTRPEVLTDDCRSTWESCRHLARAIQEKSFEQKPTKTAKGGKSISAGGGDETSSLYPPMGARVPQATVQNSYPTDSVSRFTSHILLPPLTIITSDYHAPRVRWLLTGLLPSPPEVYGLRSEVYGHPFSTPRNRLLIRGECVSWLYCGPLGLLYRPWWLVGLGGVLIAGGMMRRK